MPERCQFTEPKIYFWGEGLVDPSEPEYVAGKGVPIRDGDTICQMAADPGEKLCPRHKAICEQAAPTTEDK